MCIFRFLCLFLPFYFSFLLICSVSFLLFSTSLKQESFHTFTCSRSSWFYCSRFLIRSVSVSHSFLLELVRISAALVCYRLPHLLNLVCFKCANAYISHIADVLRSICSRKPQGSLGALEFFIFR